MANNEIIGIKFDLAGPEIARIREGINNLHRNFDLIDTATNDIVNTAWKGQDAEAYKNSIAEFTDILKKQTEGLTELVNILDRQIEEDKAYQEEATKAIQNK
jgi:hypothetical protein